MAHRQPNKGYIRGTCPGSKPTTPYQFSAFTFHRPKVFKACQSPVGAFNARLGIIRIGDRSIRLPANLAQGLEGLRESALAEDDPILTIKYKKFWAVLEKVCVRAWD